MKIPDIILNDIYIYIVIICLTNKLILVCSLKLYILLNMVPNFFDQRKIFHEDEWSPDKTLAVKGVPVQFWAWPVERKEEFRALPQPLSQFSPVVLLCSNCHHITSF